MPYIQRNESGVIVGVYVSLQPGFAEEWLEDNDPEVIAFLNPPEVPDLPHLNHGGLVRFTGVAPSAVLENIRMSGVTRIAKGRYRVTHETAMPSDQYSVLPSVFDINPRNIRVTARTAGFVEVRVTDEAGVAQDASELTVKTERVVTP